jgi:hypothetical protein
VLHVTDIRYQRSDIRKQEKTFPAIASRKLEVSVGLPQQIPVRYAEDDAGYVSMRPVVKQTFRLNELMDMIVSVVGKDAGRVQQIFRTGTVIYNGYHYWWDPISADAGEVESLVAGFPDNDPSRPFDPERVSAVLLESGGGTQRSVVEIRSEEAKEKKLFGKRSAWNVLINFAVAAVPRYEKYSHGRHADLFRVTLSFEQGQELLQEMVEIAPHSLRHRWSTLRPPAALTFVCPR